MPTLQTRSRRYRSLNRGNKTRKTLRRPKSSEPYKNITVEKVGEGGYGIVSRPPARCQAFFSNKNKNVNSRNTDSIVFYETYYKNRNYVSKLTEKDSAQKELEMAEIIKKYIRNWQNYYCLIEFMCRAPTTITNESGAILDTYAIAPYCGVTMDNILDGKIYFTPAELCCLVDSLKKLVIGVGELHSIRLYHQDIHPGNILYNAKTDELLLIDFGLATDLDYLAAEHPNTWRSESSIISSKLLDTQQLIYKVIGPFLSYVREILDAPEIIEKSGELVDECYKKILTDLSSIPRPRSVRDLSKEEELGVYMDFMAEFLRDFDETEERCKWKMKVLPPSASVNALSSNKNNTKNSTTNITKNTNNNNKKKNNNNKK